MPITYDDVTTGQPLPLYSLTVSTIAEVYTFTLLEGESSWNLDAILAPTDTGTMRTVAYKLRARAIVMYNNYGDMAAALKDIAENAVGFTIGLEGLEGYSERRMSVGLSGATVVDQGVSWLIESVEHRPRLVIDCIGYASRDILDEVLFEQLGSQW